MAKLAYQVRGHYRKHGNKVIFVAPYWGSKNDPSGGSK